jgi:hypothetical protein
MDGARNQLGSLPGVMDRSAAAFGVLSENFETIGTKTKEFAAGFIEAALPALNTFTSALTGVDAAGFGQKLMSQVMNVADFLIGAFKAPMPAIEAIGSALETGVKIAGNNYLNSLINAGKFLSSFFSSDLPGIISGVLGNTLIKSFIDSAKAFIDAIRGVITAFETWLGSAITNVVDFFTTKFSAVLGAVAQDFQSAMSDPIGFVTGKIDSALKGVMENGGEAFQTSFDKAGGSALDKISAGLGAVSDEYGDKIVAGAARAKDEFGKLVDSIEPSARDFFGAEEAAARTKDKFGEVVEAGKKLRENFEASTPAAEGAKKEVSAAASEARDIAGSFGKSENSAKNIKQELSASAKLMQSIAQARGEDAVDRGGRNAQRAQAALSRGDFRGAERAARRIEEGETETRLRGVGDARDRRDIADIGRGVGLSRQSGETNREFRQRILDVREGRATAERFGRSTPVDKPGQSGQTDGDARRDSKGPSKSPLESIVEDIKKLVEKIEPRLPVAALTA